ncbi:hypothetical protein AXK59_15980 [Tsukamurella tyrosinosolvens]|nr:hypothetical protein AXK59_15980 [Tsukamurella tyrosinosolvens]
MSVDIEHMMKAPKLLSKKEAVVVERVYDGLKKANSLSIKDYANLAMTKELAAENKRDDTKSDGRRDLDDATVAEYLDRAAQIRAEVYATQKQAQVTIIRRRISGLLSGIVTTSAVALFIAGLIGVSYSVDSIDAGRGTEKGHLELLKECAATVKVLQDAKIPVTAAPTSGSAAPLPASPQPAAAAAGTPLPSAAQLPAECGLPAR